MAKTNDIPRFGLLSGYRVVMVGLSVAAPFAAELYAEHGADVIWVETPSIPIWDAFRSMAPRRSKTAAI